MWRIAVLWLLLSTSCASGPFAIGPRCFRDAVRAPRTVAAGATLVNDVEIGIRSSPGCPMRERGSADACTLALDSSCAYAMENVRVRSA